MQEHVGKKFKEWRKANGFPHQSKTAELIGIAQPTLAVFEGSGRAGRDLRLKIYEFTGGQISAEDLLGVQSDKGEA